MPETVKFRVESKKQSARALELFDQERQEILSLLPNADVQHVGSTAVPGSLTKGDLDIQVRVSAEDFRDAERVLSKAYERNKGSTRTDCFAAFKDDLTVPPLGVQLTAEGSAVDSFWKFRELLCTRQDLRDAYDALKRRFDGGDMDAYRAEKDRFFEALRADPAFVALEGKAPRRM